MMNEKLYRCTREEDSWFTTNHGMCILDISKTLMYDFHYNYMKRKYDDGAKLLFTDTYSLCYEIKTDISPDVEIRFNTSEYPTDHPAVAEEFSVGKNKKAIGMFKDEAGGKQIEEFVGLRVKLYSYKMFEGKEHKKHKGIKKNVIKKSITIKSTEIACFQVANILEA